MAELSEATKKLIEEYLLWQKSLKPKEGTATIHVDEVAQKVAGFYEQIRTIVDWKEEHLMRRSAIIRKLKKRFENLDSSSFSAGGIAEWLVLDLIRGGYFPNDKIEDSKIQEVQHIIDKYVFIISHNPESKKNGNKALHYERLLEIASCEIEETLSPSLKEMALISYMFEKMRERIKVSEAIYQRNLLKPEEKDIQIYVAVQQALFRLDEPIISYNIIRYKYPMWDNPSEEELFKLSQNIDKILEQIRIDLVHPLARKFYKICEKYDTAYLLIGDILAKENFEKISQEIMDPPKLEGYIKSTYAKRLADLKAKINRAAIYSTISIFVTKIFTVVILLIVLSKISGQPVSWINLLIDILIPTGLMAFLVLTIKPPSKKNINIVIVEIMKIFYEKEKTDTYTVKISKKRGVITTSILSLTYLLGACISFGALFLIFEYIHLDMASIVINLIFIALILFAGSAVQKRAKELTIEDETGGVLMFLSDILFLPVTGVGQWMSNKWKRYNLITAFLNALIDMPFSTFVEFLERWRFFIRERKDDLL